MWPSLSFCHTCCRCHLMLLHNDFLPHIFTQNLIASSTVLGALQAPPCSSHNKPIPGLPLESRFSSCTHFTDEETERDGFLESLQW